MWVSFPFNHYLIHLNFILPPWFALQCAKAQVHLFFYSKDENQTEVTTLPRCWIKKVGLSHHTETWHYHDERTTQYKIKTAWATGQGAHNNICVWKRWRCLAFLNHCWSIRLAAQFFDSHHIGTCHFISRSIFYLNPLGFPLPHFACSCQKLYRNRQLRNSFFEKRSGRPIKGTVSTL